MKKIDDTKSASYQWEHAMASDVHLRRCAGVREDVSEALLAKSKFGIVGMGPEILQTV